MHNVLGTSNVKIVEFFYQSMHAVQMQRVRVSFFLALTVIIEIPL